MKRFETPEIKVTLFNAEDTVLTASSMGYGDNGTDSSANWTYNVVNGGNDGDFPL